MTLRDDPGASHVWLEMKGADEFIDKLELVRQKAPDRIYRRLDKEGRAVIKAAKANSPDGKSDPERKPRKKIRNRWRTRRVKKEGTEYSKDIYNAAPHFHLMERPHLYVKGTLHNRKIIGKHPGLFFFEKTLHQVEPEIMQEREKWLNELYEELK